MGRNKVLFSSIQINNSAIYTLISLFFLLCLQDSVCPSPCDFRLSLSELFQNWFRSPRTLGITSYHFYPTYTILFLNIPSDTTCVRTLISCRTSQIGLLFVFPTLIIIVGIFPIIFMIQICSESVNTKVSLRIITSVITKEQGLD